MNIHRAPERFSYGNVSLYLRQEDIWKRTYITHLDTSRAYVDSAMARNAKAKRNGDFAI